MHDDTQVARVFEMQKSLSDGMFPVRWVANLGYGYGYPIFNYYAPLAYYVGGVFNLVGVDALIATKLMMGIGIVLAGIFMYLLAREFWGKTGAIISSVLYLYAPYHAVDIYVRGDVAEFWAYAFIPLAFWGIYKTFLFTGKKIPWIWIITAALGYAGVILSHNLSALMLTPFLLLFAAILFVYSCFHSSRTKGYFLFAGFFLGIMLSAFYWLPALSETGYTNVSSVITGGSQYKDHFVCLPQLWNSPWGFGGSAPGCTDGLSFKVGKFHILLALLSVIPLVYFWKKSKIVFILIIYAIIALLFSVFLTLQQSKFLWDMLTPMAFFQFPWRFLVLISFFTSFLSGALFFMLSNIVAKRKITQLGFFVFSITITLGIIMTNAKLFVPQKVLQKTTIDYTNLRTLEWETSQMSDEYLPKNFAKPTSLQSIPISRFSQVENPFRVISVNTSPKNIFAEITARKQTRIRINQAFFPGWKLFLDNTQISEIDSNKGIIFTLPKGTHTINLQYHQTNVELFSDFLSMAGILVILAGIICSKITTYGSKKK